jgi:hypothetical protein
LPVELTAINDIIAAAYDANKTAKKATTGDYIRLTSNIESGIVPLEVTLRVIT